MREDASFGSRSESRRSSGARGGALATLLALTCVLGAGADLAMADCPDTTHTVTVWYTRDGLPPGDEALIVGEESDNKCQKGFTSSPADEEKFDYRMGQCYKFLKGCSTDNCGWGDWRTPRLQDAVNRAVAALGGTTCGTASGEPCDGVPASADDPSKACADNLILAGATISGGATRTRWSVSGGSNNESTPAIGSDGIVYTTQFGSSTTLLALDPVSVVLERATGLKTHPHVRGATSVAREPSALRTSPAVGADGTVYLFEGGALYAYKRLVAGQLWKLQPSGVPNDETSDFPPAIGRDGTIYVATTRGVLFAVAPDGTLRWSRSVHPGQRIHGPSLGPDGTIYLGCRDHLHAVNATDGSDLWQLSVLEDDPRDTAWVGQPAVDFDGTVFARVNRHSSYSSGSAAFSNRRLVAFHLAGGETMAQRWSFPVGSQVVSDGWNNWRDALGPAPLIDRRGGIRTVYVAGQDGKLVAVREKADVDNRPVPYDETRSPVAQNLGTSPAIGVDGTVYIASGTSLVALDGGDLGLEKWRVDLGAKLNSPVLDRARSNTYSNLLYVTTTDGRLHSIVVPSAEAATGGWPMLHRDSAHSAHAERSLIVRPLAFDFGEVARGEQAVREFVLENLGDDRLQIQTKLASPGGFTLTKNLCGSELDAGQSCRLEVTFKPASFRRFDASLVIEAGDKRIRVPLRGLCPGPIAELSSSRLVDGRIDDGVGRIDFGVLVDGEEYLAGSSEEWLTVKNAGVLPLEVKKVELSSVGDFRLEGLPELPTKILPEASTGFRVVFEPLAPGLKTAVLRIESNDPTFPVIRVLLFGIRDAAQGSSLIGFVLDEDTKAVLGKAELTLRDAAEEKLAKPESDDDGLFRIDGLAAGTYEIEISKKDYVSGIFKEIVIPADAVETRIFELQSSCATGDEPARPRIVSITSRYTGHVTYTSGIAHWVRHKAKVDWCGVAAEYRGPVKFRWSTASGPQWQNVPVADDEPYEASILLDMGTLAPCSRLTAQALQSGGPPSWEKLADLAVMDPPWIHAPSVTGGWLPFAGGSGFHTSLKTGIPRPFLSQDGESAQDPNKRPWNKVKFGLKWVPTLLEEYDSSGTYRVTLAWDNAQLGTKDFLKDDRDPKKVQEKVAQKIKESPSDAKNVVKKKFAGDLWFYPAFSLEGTFDERSCRTDVAGELAVIGEANASFVTYFYPPFYLKVQVGATVDLTARVEGIGPEGDLRWGGFSSDLAVWGKAGLGAGLADILAAEAWAKGTVTFGLPSFQKICAEGDAGLTLYLLFWEETWRWGPWGPAQWGSEPCDGAAGFASFAEVPVTRTGPTLVSRDYAGRADYASFAGGGTQLGAGFGAGDPEPFPPQPSIVQEQVFPYSETALSAADGQAHLVWLYDDPARAAANRTKILFSTWAGHAWSDPLVVADDGTADFHPDVLAFADGSALVAWESLAQPPGEQPTREGMLASLDVCVATYDPNAEPAGFTTQHCFFPDDGRLDRTPRLAGSSADDAILVWVSNQAKDPTGGPEAPNTLWFSRYPDPANPGRWTNPARITDIAEPLLTYSLAYDGTRGYLVMGLDTDQQTLLCAGDGRTPCQQDSPDCDEAGGECTAEGTIRDRELFVLEYDGFSGTWSGTAEPYGATRLTADDVPDANPRLARDGSGRVVLVWLRGNELVSVGDLSAWLLDRDPGAIRTVWQDEEYSANLAGFSLASGGGQLAIVWSEPTENYRDLRAVFYDPRHESWGAPRAVNAPDAEIESYLAAGFQTDPDTARPVLLTVYDRTEFTERDDAASGEPSGPVRGRTDLAMVRYALRDDPALAPYSLRTEPAKPRPGETVAITVEAVNQGDTAVEALDVRFYADHGAGPQPIGPDLVATGEGGQPLKPGDAVELTLSWTVPGESVAGLRLSAEVDPTLATDDRDRTNNHAELTLLRPDLTVLGASWQRVTGSLYLIRATALNRGSIASDAGAASIRIYEVTPGALRLEQSLPVLAPDDTFEVSLLAEIDPTGPGRVEFLVVVDEEQAVVESDEANNDKRLVVLSPDLTAPQISVPADILAEATGPAGCSVEYLVSASDDLPGAVELECLPPSASTFALGSTTVSCTATDLAGNRTTAGFIVTVRDTTPPQLEPPADLVVDCTGLPTTPAEPGAAYCHDTYCLDNVTVQHDAPAAFPFGDSVVTWTGTDCNSNGITATQIVTVRDVTAPELTVPTTEATECSGPEGTPVAIGSASAVDDCCGDTPVSNDAPPLFPLGQSLVTWRAVDCNDQSVSEEQSIVVVDTVAPAGSIVGPVPASCHGPAALPVLVQDDFQDVCSLELARSYDPGPGPAYDGHGDWNVTLSVEDPSLNVGTGQVFFTIDRTAPAVAIQRPPDRASIPTTVPLIVLFDAHDADGASGDVLHEVVYVAGCPIFDGLTYGNGDGLLSDEQITIGLPEMCRVSELCGVNELHEPELRVQATDCGGNVGVGAVTLEGSARLRPGLCGN